MIGWVYFKRGFVRISFVGCSYELRKNSTLYEQYTNKLKRKVGKREKKWKNQT